MSNLKLSIEDTFDFSLLPGNIQKEKLIEALKTESINFKLSFFHEFNVCYGRQLNRFKENFDTFDSVLLIDYICKDIQQGYQRYLSLNSQKIRSQPSLLSQFLEAIVEVARILVREDNNKKAFLEKGGIDLILKIMKEIQTPKIQQRCCGIIQNLCVNDKNETYVLERDGLGYVCKAMKNFPDDPGVQERGCGALLNFAVHEQNWNALYEAGAVNLVLYALGIWIYHEGCAENSCAAIRNLSLDQRNIPSIASALPSILKVISIHQNSPEVIEDAVAALHNLSSRYQTKLLIGENGGIPALLKVASQFPNILEIQESVAGSLRNLSSSDRNRTQIIESNGISVIRKALSNFPDSPEIAEHVVSIYWHLSFQRGGKFYDRSLLSDIYKVLERFPIEKNHVLHGCVGALGSIQFHQPYLSADIFRDTSERLVFLRNSFIENMNPDQECSILLTNLSTLIDSFLQKIVETIKQSDYPEFEDLVRWSSRIHKYFPKEQREIVKTVLLIRNRPDSSLNLIPFPLILDILSDILFAPLSKLIEKITYSD